MAPAKPSSRGTGSLPSLCRSGESSCLDGRLQACPDATAPRPRGRAAGASRVGPAGEALSGLLTGASRIVDDVEAEDREGAKRGGCGEREPHVLLPPAPPGVAEPGEVALVQDGRECRCVLHGQLAGGDRADERRGDLLPRGRQAQQTPVDCDNLLQAALRADVEVPAVGVEVAARARQSLDSAQELLAVAPERPEALAERSRIPLADEVVLPGRPRADRAAVVEGRDLRHPDTEPATTQPAVVRDGAVGQERPVEGAERAAHERPPLERPHPVRHPRRGRRARASTCRRRGARRRDTRGPRDR